jgi:CheY-like chemotaxis protein
MQFSRKQPKSRFSTLNLVEVIQETHNLIRESFDKKIDIQVAYTDPLPISGSLSGLSQVFMNLCTNARDAMPEGGQLKIEADRKGDDVEVLISDTGVGMDKEIKEKCFDPFFTTKEADKGTGLGLSTTYGIVKTHGGNIHVESESGKGTVFKIYFPLAGWEDEDRPDDAPETISGSGQKILIVDDEIDTLEPLEDLLESMGYQAASAGSGKAALEKQKSWKPDAVLLDRNMPEMDGVECAERMIENDPSVKIIIVSGYDETGPDSIDARSRQMIKGYLTKPVNMSELSIALAQAFH